MPAAFKSLSWGIIGTGSIAQKFARALTNSHTGKLVAVSSRQLTSAESFACQYPGVRAYGSEEELLLDPAVQVVYISTPHPFHAPSSLRAAAHGKHILCEKPMAMTVAEATTVLDAARSHGVFFMEAFMYRTHPQTARLLELIRSGAVGKVGLIRATFSFQAEDNPQGRLLNPELGGGGIRDVGCYTTSISRLIAGAANGQTVVEPSEFWGCAVRHPQTGVDRVAVASVLFPGEILAQLSCGVGLDQETGLTIYGSQGSLYSPSPFVMSLEGGESSLFLRSHGVVGVKEIIVQADRPLYSIEADVVGEAIARGQCESPLISWSDSLGNMALLERWLSCLPNL